MKLIAPPLTVAINFLRKKSEAINLGKQLTLGMQKTWKQLTFWVEKIRLIASQSLIATRSEAQILYFFACGGLKSI